MVAGDLHEQRSCVNILPVVSKVPVMQSRLPVADGSQPQEFPASYLPVNAADLEGSTQGRGAVQASHFQVDSVPKLRRCFCCAQLARPPQSCWNHQLGRWSRVWHKICWVQQHRKSQEQCQNRTHLEFCSWVRSYSSNELFQIVRLQVC